MEMCLQTGPGPVQVPPDDPLGPLVALVAGGSESALGSLYDAASPRVFGLALRILRDRPAAEEATIDVFSQAWRQAGRYDAEKGTVLAWLLNLARSRAIDLLRSRAKQNELETALDGTFDLSDPEPGPERSSLEEERARRVRAAMSTLPSEQRRVLEVVYFSGLSHTEAAEALGQPLGTVKTRIRMGLSALRRALATAQEGLA